MSRAYISDGAMRSPEEPPKIYRQELAMALDLMKHPDQHRRDQNT